MNKHTPGPWEAFTEDSFSGWWAIRQVETALEVGSGDGGDTEADARLKAAAPELLEALEAAKVYVTCAYECAFPDEQQNDLVLQMIEQAIAKAKGEV